MLFNEPEVLAAIGAAIGTEADAFITIEEHERKKKPGKKAIPEDFPRVPIIHDIPESEKICAHDGTALVVIGHEFRQSATTTWRLSCGCCFTSA